MNEDTYSMIQTTAEAMRFPGYVKRPSQFHYQAALKSGDIALATQHAITYNLFQRIATWPQPKD